ncbi:zona pellucida sperm-binding protein 3-like [Clupea harengus]|uniref:Zona pellucida sperm-binding protein 3-like n=1 Tax=Clupea harengus TaxID=7950 RepID=A0A8M1KC84_CLUHA|nr:zona pellucida sperm-binding protein 3-like [Clupea harengus]
MQLTDDLLVYKNVLNYLPTPTSDGNLRSNRFAIPMQCEYSRQLSLESEAIEPTWVPYLSTVKAEDFLQLSLRLMTSKLRHGGRALTDCRSFKNISTFCSCLVDGRLAGSGSQFLPRLQDDDKLHFTLDTFLFYQHLYNPCSGWASSTKEFKCLCCSWRSVDGNDQVCGSCDVSQRMEEPVITPARVTPATTITFTTQPTLASKNQED